MQMKPQTIVNYLRTKARRPLKAKELARALGVPTREYRSFKSLLRELTDSGTIYRVRRGRYASTEKLNLIVGRLQITRGGFGFVIPEEGGTDVFVRSSGLGNAYAEDRVVVRIDHPRRTPNPEGTIVKVLERSRTQVVGIFRKSGRYGFVVPEDRRFHRDVFVAPDSEIQVREGDVVVARIVDWGSGQHDPVGEIFQVLGVPDAPGVDVLSIIHQHQLPTEFPAEVDREAEAVVRRAASESATEGRSDYRELLTFTIDPVDARDHDDALSIEARGKGTWRVGVHIADVSHYVAEGSTIDAEALSRGTSVYLVDRVLPMLPEVLSGDLCSLRPAADRFTLSVLISLDADGRVQGSSVEESIIRSRHKLSYEQAQEIIDGKQEASTGLVEALRQLRDLSLKLRKRRRARGGLDFDLPEARVVLNAAGEPTHVEELLRLESHRLIEEFMILANECVAQMAVSRDWPFIYRVHESPDPARLQRLREFVAKFGLTLAKDAHRSPKPLQRLLAAVDGRPEETLVSTLALRSLKQAVYHKDNKSHFGLGSKAYAHFTSPIRRYPDLAIHRIVRQALFAGQKPSASLKERVAEVAAHASIRERIAMDAERSSVELKKMEYMESHIGDEFKGTVSGVTAFGLFVLIDGVLVEGLLHVSNLEDDYYRFQEDEFALVGESRGHRFRLGDRLTVSVRAVDRSARELDLALVG